jgi:hypothetical protein
MRVGRRRSTWAGCPTGLYRPTGHGVLWSAVRGEEMWQAVVGKIQSPHWLGEWVRLEILEPHFSLNRTVVVRLDLLGEAATHGTVRENEWFLWTFVALREQMVLNWTVMGDVFFRVKYLRLPEVV